MAFRGRGRGRGRGQGRGSYFMNRMAKHEPFVSFPDDVKLPGVSNFLKCKDEYALHLRKKIEFERFFRKSPYYLKNLDEHYAEIDQFDEKIKFKDKELKFGNFMELNPSYFPAELIQGQKMQHIDSNKPLRDTKKDVFSMFEKLEEKMDADGEKTKDNEDESEESEKEEIESSDDDYTKFEHFDDDEDNLTESEPEEDYYE